LLEFLAKTSPQLVPNPLLTPDLVTTVSFLLPMLKKELAGLTFSLDEFFF
jgi:hypothetical protein